MLLFAKEEGVDGDITLKVSMEKHFNLASCLDVRWSNIWKHLPRSERTVRYEIGILVHSSALFFLVGVLGFSVFVIIIVTTSIFTTFNGGLSDVIVSLGASDLSKEAQECC